MSLPLRKCGLKLIQHSAPGVSSNVTSLAEVWIETGVLYYESEEVKVTSLAEVWIETLSGLPSSAPGDVTSLAEVWIETIHHCEF